MKKVKILSISSALCLGTTLFAVVSCNKTEENKKEENKTEENVNVTSLAKQLFMSRERLSQIFLKYSDMKVNDYIDSLRIDNVNRLFKDGLSITEAAFESGFQCIRTFNSTYKKIMGITPSQYIQTSKKSL